MTEQMKEYVVKAALAEDINSPFIWFSDIPCSSREIVKIENETKSKLVWCEVVKASDNFIKRYNSSERTNNLSGNEPFIAINQWYRKELGLEKNTVCQLKVTVSSKPLFLKQLLASYRHPDNSVRLAVDLAFVSVILGAIGLFLGVISLCK